MSPSPTIVLASESPRRRKLLAAMGWRFSVCKAEFAEITASADPETLPLINALGKAGSVAGAWPAALVIGADTVVLDGERIIGKPRDREEARAILLSLAGRVHRVVTGVALRRRSDRLCRAFTATTEVYFKPFDAAVAGAYLDRVHVLDKAGAYALQEHGDMLIERVAGSEANAIGLPVEMLQSELEKITCCA